MANELIQTKGSVKINGILVGFDGENTFREGKTKNGEGLPYRSASLSVKTSPTNVVYNLDAFGQEDNDRKVKVFSNKGGEKRSLEIAFKDRNDIPDGFTAFGFGTVRTAIEKDSNNKAVIKNYFTYDAVEKIKEALKDGDSVWVNAEFSPNTYVKDGETRTTVKYAVNGIGLSKNEINFEDEEFKEVASFEQELVVVNVDLDKETKKVYVTGRLIKYNKTWDDIVFVVDGNKYEKLAININKKFKFGDFVKVQGIILNGTVMEEVEEKSDGFDWGGEEPQGVQKFTKSKISELQITNVVSHEAKKFKEEDFFVDDQDPFNSDGDSPFDDDAGENPFA